ncbi:hypothetical protein [Lysobacter sp. Hz 25]|uniref:hypothetical protein n=1 Tax=Lysobacter sp. Hz 25 TaxID=3383698 RepID=UPI0038D4A690
MAEIYGHKWTSANGETPEKGSGETWAKALAALTVEQIAQGIEASVATGDPWPPTLPEFRMRCFGIPSFAMVNDEILSSAHADRSPFARFVWQHIDGWRHRGATERKAEQMRRLAYDAAVAKVIAGHPLPEPVAGELELDKVKKPRNLPLSREERVERMRQVLGPDFNPDAAGRVTP